MLSNGDSNAKPFKWVVPRTTKCEAIFLRHGRQFFCSNQSIVYYSKSTGLRKFLCKKHHKLLVTHEACTYCGVSVEKGKVLHCWKGHRSHRCRTMGDRSRCSHCESLNWFEISIGTELLLPSTVTLETVLSLFHSLASRPKDDVTSTFDTLCAKLNMCIREKAVISGCATQELHSLAVRALHNIIESGPIPLALSLIKLFLLRTWCRSARSFEGGALLEGALRRGDASLVLALRECGAPVGDRQLAITWLEDPAMDGGVLVEALRADANLFGVVEESPMPNTPHVIIPDLSDGCERFPIRVVNDVDECPLISFTYSPRVVDSSGILADRPSSEALYCDCVSSCDASCHCWSGAYVVDPANPPRPFETHKSKRVRLDALEMPIAECGRACACSLHCGNRIAQKGSVFPLEVFRSRDRGWGLRTLTAIPRGAFICEYTGELLTDDAANDRDDKYLFETVLGCNKYTIDAQHVGNVARFINHSCDPNAKVGMVSWEPDEEPLNHLCIFAAHLINANEEITIDYGFSWWRSNLKLLSCRCGSPSCRYTEERRREYLETNVMPRMKGDSMEEE